MLPPPVDPLEVVEPPSVGVSIFSTLLLSFCDGYDIWSAKILSPCKSKSAFASSFLAWTAISVLADSVEIWGAVTNVAAKVFVTPGPAFAITLPPTVAHLSTVCNPLPARLTPPFAKLVTGFAKSSTSCKASPPTVLPYLATFPIAWPPLLVAIVLTLLLTLWPKLEFFAIPTTSSILSPAALATFLTFVIPDLPAFSRALYALLLYKVFVLLIIFAASSPFCAIKLTASSRLLATAVSPPGPTTKSVPLAAVAFASATVCAFAFVTALFCSPSLSLPAA